ncbi:Cupredoxin [Apodospora peruviana]|uniref:Cupredoxin n=1 Tax=Apodospora peruviana TaxID=516989 RepID=A0AAE0IR61_9PEZI|nr:Cupredoxin [Apodospora peruviana]
MRFSSSLTVLLSGVTSFTTAAPAGDSQKRGYCENSPISRGCWGNFNIADDVTYTWPNTGVTRYYNFNVGLKTLAPDGYPKQMMVVNGQYPGPTIEANWGDDVQVRVCNFLSQNGTGLHFHGIRQLNTNYADGATSQTECPIAPGDCHTYRWKATQHGSSWYHSHYSIQYGDGVLGPIVIHGPNTADWDVDLGPLLLTDYYHDSVFDIAQRPLVKSLGIPPVAINGLINGRNVFDDGGSRTELKFAKGKKHLLRLVNTGSEVTFRFAIDKHKMTVVAMDFVPIVPYETKTLLIAIGQRYDVIVEADQDAGDYWARAVPMLTCFSINLEMHNIRAIVRYNASSNAEPTILGGSTTWPMIDTCRDEDLENLVPYIPHDVGESVVTENFDAQLLPYNNDSYALRWQVGGPRPYKPLKGYPVVKQLFDNPGVNVTDDLVPIDLTHLQGVNWVYVIVESLLPLPHPLHLHGHDTYVLARGGGLYLDSLIEVQTVNPPRRDTVNLPQNGFVVLAFQTDNPGSWLLHCHIEWHLHDGFAMSIIEGSKSKIRSVYANAGEDSEMQRVCANWTASELETRD